MLQRLCASLMIQTPTDLLVRAGERDRAAFRQLYVELGPRVKGYVLRLCGDAGRAEEITQDVFLTVWRRAPRFDPERATAETWIFTIARNRAIDTVRRARLPQPDERDPAWVPAGVVASDEVVDERRRAERVQQALDALPEPQRQVLHEAFYEARSYATIAEEQGVPLGTIKSRARLAFERLRSKLAGEGS
jgi:RNA polymerase sigma factor (sigma-70 family)